MWFCYYFLLGIRLVCFCNRLVGCLLLFSRLLCRNCFLCSLSRFCCCDNRFSFRFFDSYCRLNILYFFFSVVSAFLRGRPTLRLGAAAFSALASTAGVSFSLFVPASLEGCALAGVVSLAFVISPPLVAEAALSSFLAGVTRGERFSYRLCALL